MHFGAPNSFTFKLTTIFRVGKTHQKKRSLSCFLTQPTQRTFFSFVIPKSFVRLTCLAERGFWIYAISKTSVFPFKNARVTVTTKDKSHILLPKYACGAGAGAFPAGLHKTFNMYCKHLLSAVKHICCNLSLSLMLSVNLGILPVCTSTFNHSTYFRDV